MTRSVWIHVSFLSFHIRHFYYGEYLLNHSHIYYMCIVHRVCTHVYIHEFVLYCSCFPILYGLIGELKPGKVIFF